MAEYVQVFNATRETMIESEWVVDTTVVDVEAVDPEIKYANIPMEDRSWIEDRRVCVQVVFEAYKSVTVAGEWLQRFANDVNRTYSDRILRHRGEIASKKVSFVRMCAVYRVYFNRYLSPVCIATLHAARACFKTSVIETFGEMCSGAYQKLSIQHRFEVKEHRHALEISDGGEALEISDGGNHEEFNSSTKRYHAQDVSNGLKKKGSQPCLIPSFVSKNRQSDGLVAATSSHGQASLTGVLRASPDGQFRDSRDIVIQKLNEFKRLLADYAGLSTADGTHENISRHESMRRRLIEADKELHQLVEHNEIARPNSPVLVNGRSVSACIELLNKKYDCGDPDAASVSGLHDGEMSGNDEMSPFWGVTTNATEDAEDMNSTAETLAAIAKGARIQNLDESLSNMSIITTSSSSSRFVPENTIHATWPRSSNVKCGIVEKFFKQRGGRLNGEVKRSYKHKEQVMSVLIGFKTQMEMEKVLSSIPLMCNGVPIQIRKDDPTRNSSM